MKLRQRPHKSLIGIKFKFSHKFSVPFHIESSLRVSKCLTGSEGVKEWRSEEGDVRGVWKPQKQTEIRQKTANRIWFFPKYQNHTYMDCRVPHKRRVSGQKPDGTATWPDTDEKVDVLIKVL